MRNVRRNLRGPLQLDPLPFNFPKTGNSERTVAWVEMGPHEHWKAALNCGHAVYFPSDRKPEIGQKAICPVHPCESVSPNAI